MLSPSIVLRRLASLLDAGKTSEAKELADAVTRDGGLLVSDAFVSLQAPIAPLTWEVFGTLPSNALESEQLPVKFPRPMQLIGVRPTIRPLRPDLPVPPLVVPTLDDVMCSIVIDQERQLTAQQNPATTTAAQSQYVTAGSLALGLPRLLCQDVRSPTPQFYFQFRWRQGINIFTDCTVSMAVFARYRDDGRGDTKP